MCLARPAPRRSMPSWRPAHTKGGRWLLPGRRRCPHDGARIEPWRPAARAGCGGYLGVEFCGHEAGLAGPEPHAAGRLAVHCGVAAFSAVRAAPGLALAVCGGLWVGAGAGTVWFSVPRAAAGHDGRHGLGGHADASVFYVAAGRPFAGRARQALAVVGPAAGVWGIDDHRPGPWRRARADDAGRFCAHARGGLHVGGVQPGGAARGAGVSPKNA